MMQTLLSNWGKSLWNSSGAWFKSHHVALSTACPLMELWLDALIDRKTAMLKMSWFRQIGTHPPVYVLLTLQHSGCIIMVAVGWGGGAGQVQARRTGQGITRCMRHWHKSEHLGYYITSPVRGKGWMLMTFWWMTDSAAIGSDDGSQPDWTGRWPR